MNKEKVKSICADIIERIESKHIGVFEDLTRDVFLISEQYPGVWLEHVYDSIFYENMFPEKGKGLAKNTIELFIDRQKENGLLPCYVRDSKKWPKPGPTEGYSQIQECVSFGSLCLKTYELVKEREFLEKCRDSLVKWVDWLEKNRRTSGRGLIEMFVGFDTGHDNSARLEGLSCPGNYMAKNGKRYDADVLPPNDNVAPILAVDMNCNYYGNVHALAEMEKLLGNTEKAKEYDDKAKSIKKLIFDLLFDKDTCFFYDVDKHGRMNKCKSCTIFHLFLEKVLDKDEDKELINEIFTRHIFNPEEFWTAYPFPSMAANDASFKKVTPNNCWGYFSQGLIALRSTLWMDFYGKSEEFDILANKWVDAWTNCYETMKLGQELDPFDGTPSDCSQWYSSCMLFYLYSAKRLSLI